MMVYDVFHVKITLEVRENGQTRYEKYLVLSENKHCYVDIT